MSDFIFQVNLGGVIDLLSNHLYSDSKVFIRELLQNATDAITMRQQIDKSHKGEITLDLVPATNNTPATLVLEDNGIGLTESEIHQFLSSIGSSIKRHKTAKKQDFIGQFGIGLLSCFMVTDKIVMVTSSIKTNEAFKWEGNADGTYVVTKLDYTLSPGTKIYLQAKDEPEIIDRFYNKERLIQLVQYYGDLLPFPIRFVDEAGVLNATKYPFHANASTSSLLDFGRREFNIDFFDAIKIQTEDGKTSGVAFILPYAVGIKAEQQHRVYLKRILISEKVDAILPQWAVFIKCVVDSKNLRPTASRESFYEDEVLERTKQQLGDNIKRYMVQLANEHPYRMNEFLKIHGVSAKLLALEDPEFFKIIIDSFSFNTNYGKMTLKQYLQQTDVIRHLNDIDDFRQVSSIASSQGQIIINSAYMYDAQLLNALPTIFPDRKVERVSVSDFVQEFEEVDLKEHNEVFDFIEIANDVLAEFNCKVAVKHFEPAHTLSLYYANEEMNFRRNIQTTRKLSTNKAWGGILDSLSQNVEQTAFAELVLNFNTPFVQKLVKARGERVHLYLKVIYVQSLMASHYPIQHKEMEVLNTGLMQLLDEHLK